MNEQRRVVDDELFCHFVTFSCANRRRLLDSEPPKRIVLETLGEQLTRRSAKCVGYVVMPDHVHAAIWFPETVRLSGFMQSWKRISSFRVARWYEANFDRYADAMGADRRVWLPKYYAFSIYSPDKLREKLEYMHANPVRAGLVERAVDWEWSSAGWYESGKIGRVPVTWIG